MSAVNDIDYGITNDDLSIKLVQIDDEVINLKEGEFMNPYFVDLDNKTIDKFDEKKFHSTYKRVLIMCMRLNYNKNSEALKIFDMITTMNDLDKLKEYFVLMECSKKILYCKMQKKRALCIEKKYLEMFNHHNLKLDNDEIIVPIFELKEDTAMLHVKTYETTTKITDIKKMLSLNSYYNFENKYVAQQNLCKLMMDIKESNYWSNKHNCNITFNKEFSERSFQWKDIMGEKIKMNILKQNEKMNRETLDKLMAKMVAHKDNYNLPPSNTKMKYVDLGSSIKSQQKRSYYATIDNDNLSITKEQVTKIIMSMSEEKELIDFFNTMLISKEYCHMVINNKDVLKKMNPIINKHLPLYRYLFGYAWVSFYIESCLFKTKTTKSHRFVFDIETANLLPTFPFCSEDIYQNPYMVFLVSSQISDIQKNCMSLTPHTDFDCYTIDTLENFKYKFNIYCSGCPNTDIFKGLEWGSTFAVSGSVMPSLSRVKHPLFDLIVDKKESKINQYLTFFNHYFSESDIDLMCGVESVFDFMDNVKLVADTVETNLKTKLDIEPVKGTLIIINGQYLTEKLSDIRDYTCDQTLTIDKIMNSLANNEIKEYFYNIYSDAKRKNNKIQRSDIKTKSKNPLYESYFKMSSIDEVNLTMSDYEIDSLNHKDCETIYHLNDFKKPDEQVLPNKNIQVLKIAESVKFKLRSNKMLHCIEIFKTNPVDYFSVVGRFHLPCVRAYYNGDNIHMMPEFITAMKTGINVDYKYFAGVRDPNEILNKYRSWGFSTFLNTNELQRMFHYNSNIPKWSGMYSITDTKDRDNNKKLFGFKEIDHDLYKLKHFTEGLPMDIYKKVNLDYIKSLTDLKRIYKNKYNFDSDQCVLDMFKFKTVASDGTINPLSKWVIEAYLEQYGKKSD